MELKPGLIIADLKGKMGGWYIVHPTRGLVRYFFHPPILRSKAFRLTPANIAFKAADALYTALSDEERDPWIAYAKKYRKNPYIVFMAAATMNFCDGLYAPDFPPLTDPCVTKPGIPGILYPPPYECRTRKLQGAKGSVGLDWKIDPYGRALINYKHDLADPESDDPFTVDIKIDALYDPEMDRFDFHHEETVPNSCVRNFNVHLPWPIPDYLNHGTIEHKLKAWHAAWKHLNEQAVKVPFNIDCIPNDEGWIIMGVHRWRFKKKSRVVTDFRFDGDIRIYIKKVRIVPPYTHFWYNVFVKTRGLPHYTKQIGRVTIKALWDTVQHKYVLNHSYDVPKKEITVFHVKTANPVLPRYHYHAQYNGNRVSGPLSLNQFKHWDTR